MSKGSAWLISLASGTPYARGEISSCDLSQLSKQYVSTLSQNLRGLKKTGKEAEIILRIKTQGTEGACRVVPRDVEGV